MHPGNAENPEAANKSGHSGVPFQSFILEDSWRLAVIEETLNGQESCNLMSVDINRSSSNDRTFAEREET